MPNAIMKSFAKQVGKKTKTVEKLWKKCEKIVKKEYELDKEDERFYPLVVGCLKNLLGLNKQQEDAGITTATMGSYVFSPKLGDVQSRQQISSEPSQVKSEIKVSKKKNYSKLLKKMQEAVENSEFDLDDIISENVEFYSKSSNDPEEIVDKALEASAKYLKVKTSYLDELNKI